MSKRAVHCFALLIPFLVFTFPSTGLTVSEKGSSAKGVGDVPVFEDVAVHDPSIVKDGDTFYVFGTHIEAAKSKDLIKWERFTNGYTTPGNVLYGDLSENLSESFAWAGQDDADSQGGYAVWAPDVLWNEHYVNEDGTRGAYMIYYSVSSTYIRSAIGYAVSQNIEGPYEYVDTVVYSGFTREEAYDDDSDINKKWTNTHLPDLLADGSIRSLRNDWFHHDGSYNNSMFPNAIDPNVFFDRDGKMWMAYGSWSGGIYILEMDKTTGQPIYPGRDETDDSGRHVDRYFGTKIAGGFGKSGEGPYIAYDEQTGYYYLYVTYGWLGADGGYNMRVFRSKNPDGPYVDAKGQNAVLPGDVDHAPFGNKLMGNFLFERMVGDPGKGPGVGYVSPGHNSVYYDSETGRRFIVFHTRFPQRGEMFELRVHQMFMIQDGWPVVAPYRYTGETLEKVHRRDVIGEYKFINHGKDTTDAIKKPEFIRLNKNNKISGDMSGKWKKTGHNRVELTLDGTKYDGVFVRQWDPVSEGYTMTFTAMSKEGVAVWGSRQPHKTDEEIVSDVLNDLNLGDTDRVISDLTLPTQGTRNTTISWKTSDPGVVTDTGKIKRPEAGFESVTATLTATVTKGKVAATKQFDITVLPHREKGLVAHYAFEGNLKDSAGHFGNGIVSGDRIDKKGGSITYTDGKVGKSAVFDGKAGILLPGGLISSHAYSVSLWVKPEQLTLYTATFFGARDRNNWLSLVPNGPVEGRTMVWSGSAEWYDAETGTTIPTGEWTHLAFTVDEGTVRVYVNGTETYSGTDFPDVFTTLDTVFALGVNWWDPPFKGMMDELRIYEGALTASEVAKLAQADD